LRVIDRIYSFITRDQLIDDPGSTLYAGWWAAAQTDSFRPYGNIKVHREARHKEASSRGVF
jgi:hypothetical protein